MPAPLSRAAFSEAESVAIRTAISSIQAAYGRGRVAAFVSVHAYSQVGQVEEMGRRNLLSQYTVVSSARVYSTFIFKTINN